MICDQKNTWRREGDLNPRAQEHQLSNRLAPL